MIWYQNHLWKATQEILQYYFVRGIWVHQREVFSLSHFTPFHFFLRLLSDAHVTFLKNLVFMQIFSLLFITEIQLPAHWPFSSDLSGAGSSPPLSVPFSSVAQSCLTLYDPMNGSTPGRPVHHQQPQSTQTHVHQVDDANPTISSSVFPFSCPQSFPASGSFPMSQFFPSGGHPFLQKTLDMWFEVWV